MPDGSNRVVMVPVRWLAAGVAALLAAVLTVALVLHSSDDMEAPARTELTSQDLLDDLSCPAAEETLSSSTNVSAAYNCDPNASQEYVYFFDTSGDQQAWVNRTLGLNDNTSLVVGNGWALRTYTPARLAEALNIDGAKQVR